MGSNESIIYGHRHGETYRESRRGDVDLRSIDEQNEIESKTYFPNGILVRSYPDSCDVALGVVTFDQESGNRIEGLDSDGNYSSLWADLDRQGINRLIEDLRKHRDRVFGAEA